MTRAPVVSTLTGYLPMLPFFKFHITQPSLLVGFTYECISTYLNWKENKAIEKAHKATEICKE